MTDATILKTIMRPATLDDLDEAVALMNICEKAERGVEPFTADDIGQEWTSPGFEPEQGIRLVYAEDGTLIGYGELWINAPYVAAYSWGLTHPDFRRQGIGTQIMEWAEQRALQVMVQAPAEARLTLHGQHRTTNESAPYLFESVGLTEYRRSYRMAITFDAAPPAPQWPEGITVRSVRDDDDEDHRALYRAVREAFRDHFGFVEGPFEEAYARWLHFRTTSPTYDPALLFIAEDGDEIAGMSLCSASTWDAPDMGWVGTLGVRRPWRRRGLGLALLRHSFGAFYERGLRKAGLGVDAYSLTGALRLYERAGMHVDRESVEYEKELRPGVELRTQTVD